MDDNSGMELEDLVDSDDSSSGEQAEDPLASWIPANINKRVCDRFTTHTAPGDIEEKTLCHCGHAHRDHIVEALKNYKPEARDWGEKYTTYRPTDAFGELKFPMSKGGRTSKFVRVDASNNLDAVLTLLVHKWGLGKPNLVVSLLGGARQGHVKSKVRKLFRTGLMSAAETTGAWFLTRGTQDGLVATLGEALRDYAEIHTNMKNKIRAIGIVAWGTVSNKESLVNPEGSWPVDYYEEALASRRTQFLDPNHSHFLFIDDGTQNNLSVEFPFRTRLENYMQHKPKGADGYSMPVVCLVVEGGRWTLEGVRTAVKNDVPVVIVKGSGRMADILAYAIQHADEVDIEADDGKPSKKKVNRTKLDLPPPVAQEIKERLKAELGSAKVEERLKTIRECLESPSYLTVFTLSTDASKLDEAILQALIKGRKGKKMNRLKLALAWNRSDLASKVMFSAKVNWQPQEMYGMFHTALNDNKVKFVKLFQDHNVSLKDYLTCKRLLQLYNALSTARYVRVMLDREKDKNRKYLNFVDISNVMQELLGSYFRPFYTDDVYRDMDADVILEDSDDDVDDNDDDNDDDDARKVNTDEHAGDEYYDGIARLTAEIPSDASVDSLAAGFRPSGRYLGAVKFDNPNRELFLWAIVVNRLEMSRTFWKNCEEPIAAALTAEGLLKGLAERTPDPMVKDNMEERSRIWANQAMLVLNRCYRADAEKTFKLLTCVHPNYGNCTIMSLAVHTDNKKFISHIAVQTLLNRIWKARVDEMEDTHQQGQKAVEARPKKKRSEEDPDRTTFVDNLWPSKSKRLLERAWRLFHRPVTVFALNLIFYTTFLALFSYMLLTDYSHVVSGLEIVIYIWAFTLYMEEVRELLTAGEDDGLVSRISSYLQDQWNYIDLITFGLLLSGMILRLIPEETCSSCFSIGHIILAIDLIFLIVRILDIFFIHQELGPKLVMIRMMLKDLVYFFLIMLVFIVAYGVAAQAMLYPSSSMTFQLCRDVVRRAYWQMFGELLLEEVEGQVDCTTNATLVDNDNPLCPSERGTEVVPIVLAIYVLVTNILMLNLLIAMFSDTFTKIQSETDLYWSFQRYYIIKKYYERPLLPPPLIVICYAYYITRNLFQKCRITCCKGKEEPPANTHFRRFVSEDQMRKLILFEKYGLDDYLAKKKSGKEAQYLDEIRGTVATSKDTLEKVKILMDKIGVIRQSDKLHATIMEKLEGIEKQQAENSQNMRWIKKALSQQGKGVSDPEEDADDEA